jgi:hypothetical protein
VLVGVLNSDYHLNFPDLRKFAKDNQIESFMRPFGKKASMAEVTKIRQELYLRLCARIWSADRIGIASSNILGFRDPFSPASNVVSASAPEKASPKTDLARMVSAGVIEPDTRIVMNYRSPDYWADVGSDGRVRLEATGAVYTNVNDAGAIIRDTKTCDGMKYWQVCGDGDIRISLKQLRDDARNAGIIPRR